MGSGYAVSFRISSISTVRNLNFSLRPGYLKRKEIKTLALLDRTIGAVHNASRAITAICLQVRARSDRPQTV